MSYQYETSYPAYQEIKPFTGKKQQQVLDVIDTYYKAYRRPCNDRIIAVILKIPINTVTPRRNELLTLGKIYEVGKFKDDVTGRRTSFWKIVDHQISMF